MMARNDVVRVSAPNTTKAEQERRKKIAEEERERSIPRLERANPKAVNVNTMKAQLQALREDESSPAQVALRGYAQEFRDGNQVLGALGLLGVLGAETTGMFAAGSGKKPFYTSHGTSAKNALAGLRSGGFRNLSVGTRNYKQGGTGATVNGSGNEVELLIRDPEKYRSASLMWGGDGRSSVYGELIGRAAANYERENGIGSAGPVGRADLMFILSPGEVDAHPIFGQGKRLDAKARKALDEAYEQLHLTDKLRSLTVENTDPKKRLPQLLQNEVEINAAKDRLLESGDAQSYLETKIYADVVPQDVVLLVDRDAAGVETAKRRHETVETFRRMGIDYPGLGSTVDDRKVQNSLIKEATEAGITVIPYGSRQEIKTRDAAIDASDATHQAAKGGNAPGESKSSAAPKGHNPALDGYQGPKIMINPSTFRNDKDALCVAWNEAIRVFMEANSYEPQSEPTAKQRQFFADTPYADDELQLRRTILARICVFDTSVKDPTDDQLTESAQILRSIIDSGFAKTDDEIEKCERLARAIEAAVGAEPVEPKEEPLQQAPLQGPETQAAYDAGETEEEALKRLTEGNTGKTLQEDTSTFEEREKFLEERGMDTSLAETGSMDQLQKLHEREMQGITDASTDTSEATNTMAAGAGTAPATTADAGTTTDTTTTPVAGQPEQSQSSAQLSQETLAPGLSQSGERGNVLEYQGRRVSQREFNKIQEKFRSDSASQDDGSSQPVMKGAVMLPSGSVDGQGRTAQPMAMRPMSQPASDTTDSNIFTQSGSRGNVLTYMGRRITEREAKKLGLI